MGILNRCQHFNIKYFCLHPKGEIIVSGFDSLLSRDDVQEMLHKIDYFASLSLLIVYQTYCSQRTMLKQTLRRKAYIVDYWHQHVIISTAIRHLSFARVPAVGVSMSILHQTSYMAFIYDYIINIRLMQLHRIRAGPRATA
ncbi:hypothetical protein [Sodalis endosymbiont of Henestaris halophilus]|uniref:hypothetical protein n=1 Tax=Sodalis endosymbiont of Henestaris halophilus TaxID=1929246 RepID=UPI000BBF74D0|nr:hypothetical protein [Sodalis endosymbiont of Henestaris halophilus]SNC58994.1 Secretion monitor precursor [Sodalis endosymbiont of Henestaris halophilus]